MRSAVTCPFCGARVPPGRFCAACGASLRGLWWRKARVWLLAVIVIAIVASLASTGFYYYQRSVELEEALSEVQSSSPLPVSSPVIAETPAQPSFAPPPTPPQFFSVVPTPTPQGGYRVDARGIPDSDLLPGCSHYYISRSQIENWSNRDLCTLRNEFYARHGFDFSGCVHLADYFFSRPWYHPTPRPLDESKYQEYMQRFWDRMNKFERANILLIKEIEKVRGSPHLQSHRHNPSWYRPGI